MIPFRQHTVGDISLSVPQDWMVSENVTDTVIAAAAPHRDGHFTANVVVTVDEIFAGETLVGWAQRTVAALTQQVLRLRVLDLEDTEIDRRPARRVLSHYPLPGHGGVSLEQWLLSDGPRGVILSCSTAALEYDDRADLFAEVAAGLRVAGSAR